jgi:hypothetical protein
MDAFPVAPEFDAWSPKPPRVCSRCPLVQEDQEKCLT